MPGCNRVVRFDKATGQFESCSTDSTGEPQIIGVTIGNEEMFFEVQLCAFHIIATSFASNTAPA